MSAKAKAPIMAPEEERFMAFEGLVQWTQCTIDQAGRVRISQENLVSAGRPPSDWRVDGRRASHAFHCECHFFAIAANKLLEHRDWVLRHSLCSQVDFSEIDRFSRADIRDLRNMREHVVDYFQGVGRDAARWQVDTPQFSADASSVVGTLIGGRLNWQAFGAAAERLYASLLAEPIPYPSRSKQ